MPPENPYAAPQVVETKSPMRVATLGDLTPEERPLLAKLARGCELCLWGMSSVLLIPVLILPITVIFSAWAKWLGGISIGILVFAPVILQISGWWQCRAGSRHFSSAGLLGIATLLRPVVWFAAGIVVLPRINSHGQNFLLWFIVLIASYLIANGCELVYWSRVADHLRCQNAKLCIQLARYGLSATLLAMLLAFPIFINVDHLFEAYIERIFDAGLVMLFILIPLHFFLRISCVYMLQDRIQKMLQVQPPPVNLTFLQNLQ
ncbi:MAG: hypothetical protein SFX18_07660 [Pirellulales bacterium]|nr:hypothetical protein [Pirellulales bacterium]